ncbi:MAG: YitT family protein [Clostridia bacterium]|nr:YitT family protein [Clostridia bacterium]
MDWQLFRKHGGALFVILLGCAIQAFGLFHIHSFAGVTEGGVLGGCLLLAHYTGYSPSIFALLLNAVCYLLGYRVLGRGFLVRSLLSAACFSLFYAMFEAIGYILPVCLYACFTEHPWTASLMGALFIGVGAGLCVRCHAAPSGDDALAMAISHAAHVGIQWVYLVSDLLVLGLSLTYLSLGQIFWSVLTVVLSGQIIGWIQHIPIPSALRQSDLSV